MQVVPAYFLWLRPDLFLQHRTSIISVLHIAHMISGDAFGSFWPPEADFSQPLQFYTMAFVSAGNMLNLLFWYNPLWRLHQPHALRLKLSVRESSRCFSTRSLHLLCTSSRMDALGSRRGLFDMTPSTWHLGLQLLHTAKGLHEAPKNIERLQPYLYHITPFKNWANSSLLMSVLHPGGLSESFPPPLYLGRPPGAQTDPFSDVPISRGVPSGRCFSAWQLFNVPQSELCDQYHQDCVLQAVNLTAALVRCEC